MKEKILLVFKYIFIAICVIGLIYSLYNIFVWKKSVDRNKNIKKEINKHVVINEKEKQVEKKYQIDFDELKKENEDTVAYIKVNNTNIDYVVVQTSDNSYYLTHNFKKEWNIAGWIFADYKNKFDGTDKNIVIYGHSTKDGSMFGTLNKVLNSNWQQNKENQTLAFITEDEKSVYQIFSVYMIKPEDYYINTDFLSDEEFMKFISTIKGRSYYDYNVDVKENDSILTLSSCNGDGSKRVVLHAKKI